MRSSCILERIWKKKIEKKMETKEIQVRWLYNLLQGVAGINGRMVQLTVDCDDGDTDSGGGGKFSFFSY